LHAENGPSWLAGVPQGHEQQPKESGRKIMLSWSLVFLVIAIIAAVLGFGGIAGTAAGIAKILFVVFLVIWIISLVLGRR
jgi:uncharacterized membrane protein YtjA (UPF0391 family)